MRPRASLFVEYFSDAYGMGRHYRELARPLIGAAGVEGIDLRLRRLGRPGVPFRVARWAARAGGASLGLLAGSSRLVHTSLAIPPWHGGPRQVRSFHDTVSLEYPEELQLPPWTAEVLAAAAAVMTVSRFSAERIAAAFPGTAGKLHVIPAGVDPSVFHPGAAPRSGVLVVAGASRRKNLATLLAAWPAVWRERGEPLVVVGQVGAPQDGVAWRGYVDDTILARLYRESLVVAVPSLHEGFGLPVIEAMASGTPVVASQASSLPEVAGDAALLVEPAEPQAWADALIALLASAEQRESLSARGLERASLFTWAAAARQLAGLYRELLDSD